MVLFDYKCCMLPLIVLWLSGRKTEREQYQKTLRRIKRVVSSALCHRECENSEKAAGLGN